MHTWQTNIIIFRVPCWFPLFTIERFVVGAKNGEWRERTRDTTAASFVALLIVREARASSGVISSHTVSPCPLAPKCSCPSDWLANALRQRVLITLLPVNRDDGSSARSSHEPPAWLHMINPPEQNWGGGLLCNIGPPSPTSYSLSSCNCNAAPISSPHQKHPGVSLCIENSAFNWYLGKGSAS